MELESSENVVVLRRGDTTYYLVGTAHVSDASVDEVGRVIDEVQPDTVCVELCHARYNALTNERAWDELDIFKVIREGKTLFLFANMALAAHQRRIGAELGVKPGAELLEACRKAEEVGADIVLVDRDIHITLKRTWGNLSFWDKMGLLGALVRGAFSREKIGADEIEKLKEQANLSKLLEEFAAELPAVKGPLIDERDEYLMSGIEAADGKKIVAVVGAAHVPGMKNAFGADVDRDALEQLPPPKGWTRWLKWLVPALILAAFTVGYLRHEGSSLEDMLYAWILPNSIMAALLTAVAGAKLLSIITAFFSSPITSLNPLIGTGMVVGLLEAWLRKPTVKDCESINDDIQTLRGVYRNKVTRVLLVAVLSSIGSSLGAWIGLSWVIALIP